MSKQDASRDASFAFMLEPETETADDDELYSAPPQPHVPSQTPDVIVIVIVCNVSIYGHAHTYVMCNITMLRYV